jgi:hypothetical protein
MSWDTINKHANAVAEVDPQMLVGTVEHVLPLSSRSHAPRCSSIALTTGLKTCMNGTHTHIGTAFVMLDDAEGMLFLSDAFAPHHCWTLQFRRSRRELWHGLRVIRSVEAWKPMRKNSPRPKCQSDECDRVREDRELGRLYYVVRRLNPFPAITDTTENRAGSMRLATAVKRKADALSWGAREHLL